MEAIAPVASKMMDALARLRIMSPRKKPDQSSSPGPLPTHFSGPALGPRRPLLLMAEWGFLTPAD